MATSILTSRVYSNNFRPETTSFLIANVGDKIDLELQFDVEIRFTSSYAQNIEVTNNDTLTRSSGSFYEDGFKVGDILSIVSEHNTGTKTSSAIIQTLSPNLMVLSGIAGDTIENGFYPDGNNGTITIESGSSINGVLFNYGIIKNSSSGSGDLSSLIDGTTLSFKSDNVDATNLTPVPLVATGYESGGAVTSATIQGLGIVSGVQKFQINLSIIIPVLWDSLNDIDTLTKPSSFDDVECITDVIEINCLPEANNPNITVPTDGTQVALLGNTGWLNENRNGGANNFSLDSVSYLKDGFLPINAIQSNGNTSFTIVLNHPANTANDEYKIGWIWSPDTTSYYSSLNTRWDENLMYVGAGDSTVIKDGAASFIKGGTANAAGAAMNVKFNSLTRSGDTVTIKGEFQPNAAFETFMNGVSTDDLQYLLWVSLGDKAGTTLNSDRVSLKVDASDLIISEADVQPFDITNSFLNHAQGNDQIGVSNYFGASEDEVTARSIILVDTTQGEEIQEINFTIEGYNTTTQERYTLESTSYDATQFPKDASNIQQIDIDTTRGFRMAADVPRNAVKVYRDATQDSGGKIAYRSLYGFRMRWEDWLQNTQVPSAFWDGNELNNNINNNWAAKDNLSDWRLSFNIRMSVLRNGQQVDTRNTYDFNVRTYEESNVWDGSITLYDETKANSLYVDTVDNIRRSSLLTTANTWIEADFDLEDLGGDVGDITDYFGVIRMEEYRNGGLFAIDMLSTVLENESTNNLLIPLTGEAKCKITKVSSTKIRLEGYVNVDNLNFGVSNYKISARIGTADIVAGKYSVHYSLKYD